MSGDVIGIGSFAYELGDLEGKPGDIASFDELWQAESGGADFATMGCGTFRKMTGPLEDYVVAAVSRTLADRGLPAAEVDHLVFAATDGTLAQLDRDFVARVVERLGLTTSVPAMVTFQQCCSSLTALRYAWRLFDDPGVDHVVVVSFDRTPNDDDRVRSFALFGDAVASCLVSRGDERGLRLASSVVRVDSDGLLGRDSMLSRQKVAQQALAAALGEAGATMGAVTKVFPTNLYTPLTSFNAAAAGIHRGKLHFAGTLFSYGHCGNCDWMLNLADYAETTGLAAGDAYLAQASAPGFFACAVLVAP